MQLRTYSKLLLLSALFAVSAKATVINSLSTTDPIGYTITASGTYVLGSNLHYPTSDPSTYYAFFISPQDGPIVLDLRGYTLSGDGGAFRLGMGANLGISILGSDLPNHSVTIENGTISNFRVGMDAVLGSGITVKSVNFIENGLAVAFGAVGNSVVTDSTFRSRIVNPGLEVPGPIGIQNFNSTGGVRQWDNTFHFSHGGTPGVIETVSKTGHETIVRYGGSHGNHRLPVVPEANPALVLLPFLGAVLLLSFRAFCAVKA